uniref:Uncharacterized protein n=1 Tax=Zooxanthella nutricula TaxID=1333877 RepID=A0A7S2QEQ7_9DINO
MISLPHLRKLYCVRRPVVQERLRMFCIVASAPMVICFFKFSSVLWPKVWKVLFLCATLYEVIAFWTFMRLIYNMVVDDDVDYLDERIVKVLQEGAPSKLWAVPPIACCFRPLVPARKFRKCDLVAVRCLMWQFMVITPVVAVADWTSAIEEEIQLKLQKIEVLSLVLAMYALFCLLEATSARLHAVHSHSKFWTIKGIFIANTLTFRVTSALVEKDVRVGDACYSHEAMAAAWAGMVTAALAVPLAGLSRRAYPVEECFDGADSDNASDSEENPEQEINDDSCHERSPVE